MKNMKPLLSILTLIFAASAHANTSDLLEGAEWHVSVGEPRIEYADWNAVFENSVENADIIVWPNQGPTVTDPNGPAPTAIAWDKLILIGDKLIELVKASQAVVNVKRDHVGVLPLGVSDWAVTTGWKLPISRNVDIVLYSLAGFKLANASLKVLANHGGNVNGKGKFLKNVTIIPSNIKAYLGHSVDVWTEFRDPVNISSSTENPVAALGFDIRYKAASVASEKQGARDVVVTGEGLIQVSE